MRTIRFPIYLLLFCMTISIGCNREASTHLSTNTLGSTSKSPHQLLEACILNYRHAKSYRDNAIIRTFRSGSNIDQNCRIQFRRPNLLRVETSRTIIHCDGQEWSLRVLDSQDPLVQRQRWVRKTPASLDLDWMMSEPQVEMLLSDPELGIPMQLELLMHPKALDFFLQESARLSWLDPQTSDGHLCQRLAAKVQEREFVLWIDPDVKVLRRIDFPSDTQNVSPNAQAKDSLISLLLQSAEVNSEFEWEKLETKDADDAIRVRQFVVPPLPLESEKLGTTIPNFALEDLLGKVQFDSSEKRPTPTLFCWLADHPASQRTAKRLSDFYQQAKSRGLDKHFELFAIWTEAYQNPKAPEEILKSWHCELPLLVDNGHVGHKLMGVANAPTLVMLDPNNKLQAFVEQEQPNLDTILGAFLDGWIENRDLAQEKLTDYQFHRNRFISQLHILACDRIARDQLPKIEAFPPLILQRKPLWTKPSSEPILSAGIQRSSTRQEDRLLTLDQRGQLTQWDSQGSVVPLSEIPAESLNEAAWIDILPGAHESQPILVIPGELDRFVLVQRNSEKRIRRVNLQENESLVGAAWGPHPTSESVSKLYVATSKNRILVFSGQGDQLLSGDSQGALRSIANVYRDAGQQNMVAIDEKGNTHPILFNDELPPASLATALPFSPHAQRWLDGKDRFGSYNLALGDSKEEGRFVYMLSSQLVPLWHLPVSQVSSRASRLLDSWTVPRSQELYWLVQSPREVLSIIRADGLMSDTMSWGKPIISAGFVDLSGEAGVMVAFEDGVECFQVSFPAVSAEPTSELVPASGGGL